MDENTKRIAALNDELRTRGIGGQVVVTAGIVALGQDFAAAAIAAVRAFAAFTPENDPYGEHDFGSLLVQGRTIFFKVDYYDLTMQHGSKDPADPARTTRVLTIMLSEEY